MEDLSPDECLSSLVQLIPAPWTRSFRDGWSEFRLVDLPKPSGFALVLRERVHTIFAEVRADRFLDRGIQELIRSTSETEHLDRQVKAPLSKLGYILETVEPSKDSLIKIGISVPETHNLQIRQQLKNFLLIALCELLISSGTLLTNLEDSRMMLPGEALVSDELLPEGSSTRVLVNRYERDPRNRALALLHHGSTCLACGIDLGVRYGQIGAGKVHVHHVTPISQLGEEYLCDPATDLIPLCPNCHYICHQRTPPLELGELQAIIALNPGTHTPS